MTTRQFIFNHKKDTPDHRDLLFSGTITPVQLPPKFDLRSTGFVPPILDQQNLGCCAGNEISNALRFCIEKEHAKVFQPSRLFIYYFGRQLDESPLDEDTGISIRNGLKAVQKYGAPTELIQPYDISKFDQAPSKQSMDDAKQHIPNFKYLSVPQNLNSIKQAIVAGYPVILGIQVFSSIQRESTIKTGTITLPEHNDEHLGGHCVALYSYDDSTQTFGMMNTWGTSVGIKGWFTIPYLYIRNPNLASDFWTIKFFK